MSDATTFSRIKSDIIQFFLDFWNFFVELKKDSALAWLGSIILLFGLFIFVIFFVIMGYFIYTIPYHDWINNYYSQFPIGFVVGFAIIFFGLALFQIGMNQSVKKSKSQIPKKLSKMNASPTSEKIQLDKISIDNVGNEFSIFEIPNLKGIILNRLREKNVNLPCPRCGTTKFDVLDGITNIEVFRKSETTLNRVYIPTVLVICKNCGFICEHSFTSLKIPEDNQDASN